LAGPEGLRARKKIFRSKHHAFDECEIRTGGARADGRQIGLFYQAFPGFIAVIR
jgi:hypothetical protein